MTTSQMDPFGQALTHIFHQADRQAGVTPLPAWDQVAARLIVRGLRTLTEAAQQAGRDTIPIEVLDRMVTGVHDRMVPATTSQETAS